MRELQTQALLKNKNVGVMLQRKVSGVMPQRNVSLCECENKIYDSFDCLLALFYFLNYLLFDLIKELLYDVTKYDWLLV